jgi:outer membrane biosynthesis protein TonB
VNAPSRTRSKEPRAFEQCSAQAHTSAWLAGGTAFVAHGLLCGALIALGSTPSQAARPNTPLYEVELAPEPPPAAPEPTPPAEPPPEPPPPVRQPKVAAPEPVRPVEPEPEQAPPPTEAPEPPAAAAAQAADAVTATDDNAAASDTLVTGDAAHHAGGTTAQAVQAPNARAHGVEGGTGTAAVDRTRAPQLASGSSWDCPLPEEAAEEGIEQATVALVVEVAADGKVLGVEVKQDPGYGFGREARACAFKKRWSAGLDRNGQPTRGKLPVNVRFIAR